jgi:type I restriction-modification system DNA methylase subunit
MDIQASLQSFSTQPLLKAARSLFKDTLKIPLSPLADSPITPDRFFRDNLKDAHAVIQSIYLVGRVEDRTFSRQLPPDDFETIEKSLKTDYEGLFILAVDLGENHVTRSELSSLTRDFNRAFKAAPVIVVYKYDHDQTCISLASCERSAYQQQWRDGEKPGKVSLLKDIMPGQPHAAHLRFLLQLTVPERGNTRLTNFRDLHAYWQKVFDSRTLNNQFYKEISAWFQHAITQIKLPDCPAHYRDNQEAHVKDFSVRLICRTMFCWFLKERGLVPTELLELKDYRNKLFPLVKDQDQVDFETSSSYYRTILQNLFFTALNHPIKERKKQEWFHESYFHPSLERSVFERIPYINAALFEKIDDDNANNRNEDGVFRVPNSLFYSEKIEVQRGRGARNLVATKGLNRIFAQYKFTIEENTSLDEEVALDPELLGMVFENLLAEIDPNDDGSAESARKESGSYYTPRRSIDYMINEALLIYLRNAMGYRCGSLPVGYEKKIEDLIYFDEHDPNDHSFANAVIEALDSLKILDPACGSGAFPVGMLNRIVRLLQIIDPGNHLWIERQIERLPQELQEKTRSELERHDVNYPRKLGLIRNAIYGVDIQPMAVMITKLRFFISLLIDQEIDLKAPEKNFGISEMPSMETKIICANSLQNFIPELFDHNILPTLVSARRRYYIPELTPAQRQTELATIVNSLDQAFPSFYKDALGHPGFRDEASRLRANRKCLTDWFHHGSIAAPFFNLAYFFPEVATHGGFDIVIGNPPYGGTPIPDQLKIDLQLGSKDPYGAFISRFIALDPPLKGQGVIAYIVSDTFMTIKSHKPLREQILRNYIHRMVRVHPDTFNATVNTAIIVIEREPANGDELKEPIPDEHTCLMADLTRVSFHEDYARFLQLLYRTTAAAEIGEETDGDLHIMKGNNWQSESSPEYALYRYPQNLILTNSNIPFFVASSKLFSLMNDTSSPVEYHLSNGNRMPVRTIQINNKIVKLHKIGDCADVKVGLQTGDNDAYLFQTPNARGSNYRSTVDYAEFLLTHEDLDLINTDEGLRRSVIENGISKEDPNSDRYFGGRYIVPYDKGGESDADEGWMPNYWVPTDYSIDWSEWAVHRMKTLTLREKNRLNGRTGGNDRLTSRFQNQQYYFVPGLTWSDAGVYSPTIRLSGNGVFDVKGSRLMIHHNDIYQVSGIMCSKIAKMWIKAVENHTISTQSENIRRLIIPAKFDNSIGILVSSIINNQMANSSHDYASNEQLEIDRLVYEAYGLNEDDIREVENWYARRYPALAAAQRANLERKLAAEAGGQGA